MREQLDAEKGRRKKEVGNAGQPACTEGQVSARSWLFPSGRFTPAGSSGSPSPARVVQSSLSAALAVRWDLEWGWATEPVTFKQP